MVDDEDFVLHEADDRRMFVFGTHDNLKRLQEATHWLMDGTFETTPPHYQQVFTIHAFVGGKLIPLIYCLLISKSTIEYVELFR